MMKKVVLAILVLLLIVPATVSARGQDGDILERILMCIRMSPRSSSYPTLNTLPKSPSSRMMSLPAKCTTSFSRKSPHCRTK